MAKTHKSLSVHNQPGHYNAIPETRIDGDESGFEFDQSGNTKVTLGTGLNKTDDTITTHEKAGTPISLSASGQILAAPGRIIGFYVNSTTSGTIRFSDALTATTPYLGAAITPAVGYHTYPAALATGGYATIGGTALDVTVFVVAN